MTACNAPPQPDRPEGPDSLSIRDFRPGDEAALREIFFSAVHLLASRNYTTAQVAAWAPVHYDPLVWAARLQANRPFVAEIGGQAAGFADLQESGYIDQFFVAAAFAGRGVGRALMAQILASARQRHIGVVWANVSLRAETFFVHHGFAVELRQVVQRRGVRLRNARMSLRLAP